MKKEGMDFSSSSDEATKKRVAAVPKDPNVVSSQQEEDDIAKAIQLSLQESKSAVKSSGNFSRLEKHCQNHSQKNVNSFNLSP